MKRHPFVYIVMFGAALAACSQPSPPAKTASRPERDPQAAVASIRAAAAQFDSSVEVHPLRDAAVEGLLKQAQDAEAQRQPDQALASVRKALAIAPQSPDLVQYEAELLVESGDWKGAAAAAQKSYDMGPKVGSLCARNVETLIEARTTLGDTAGATKIREEASGCRVPPPARY
ncbi:MAG TPA: tetratricopeptide repeat protein [Rudaea sp.]|nr:tetratricopeptide repeat protein [Rudaea sp.]